MKNRQSAAFRTLTSMKISALVALLVLAASLSLDLFHSGASAAPAMASQEEADFFEKRVRPVFVTKCSKCHNPQAQVAGLDLTTAAGFAKGTESAPLVDLTAPSQSRLLKAVSYTGTVKMPPSGKLTDEEIAALTRWVEAGAKWPGAGAPASPPAPSRPSLDRAFTDEEKRFWAFQPLSTPAPPAVKDSSWVKSPVDQFILAALEKKGLKPAVPADKLTLLRRASYDLTGLPPTVEEQEAFLKDTSPNAFAKVVERLLASPRYGEKWGRNWLDVARYADSTGNDEDHRYPYAWKYRDYVIDSFNKDIPYNQFVMEQLAGDLIPSKDSAVPNTRGIVATGFLALGAKAIAQQDKKKMLYDVYDEQVDVTSKAFLGLTLACARCHNHKFDPLLTRDYYSMVSIFASTKSFSDPSSHVSVPLEKPLIPDADFKKFLAARKENNEKISRLRLAVEEIVDAAREVRAAQEASHIPAYMIASRRIYQGGEKVDTVAKETGLNEKNLKRWVDFLRPTDTVRGYFNEWNDASPDNLQRIAQSFLDRYQKRHHEWLSRVNEWRPKYQEAVKTNSKIPDKPRFEAGDDRFFDDLFFGSGPMSLSAKDKDAFDKGQLAELERLNQEIEKQKKLAPAEPEMACAVEDGEIVNQNIFVRGDYNNAGEPVVKAPPSIVTAVPSVGEFKGSGRLELAKWITDPANPLTHRVIVNRLWLWHFGDGLVRTPDNFGKMGDRPSHPELLDYLAAEFKKSGYSIKAMHRLIMLSSTYQMSTENPQSLEMDPDNRLIGRFSSRRLTVEEMRDALLAVDGTIDTTMGGSLQSGRGTDGENNQGRLSLNPEKLTRRTVYLPLRRANLPTLLNLFDFGDATLLQGKRQLTNVPTQALFWLNSEFLTERADNLAKLVWGTQIPGGNRGKIQRIYELVLNRKAEAPELDAGERYIEAAKKLFTGELAERKAWQSYCRVIMSSNDFIYVD